ncbi:MAG: serine/threonine-protein phosphatase [Xanthomonadales bacterium]|nr:serine/threonine-protein phosphatase [Xanthomonadales bacterium]
MLRFAHTSHIGKVRKENQDRVHVLPGQGIFLLADGVGGHRGGAVASQMAVEVIADELAAGRTLVQSVMSADAAIRQAAGKSNETSNMGTTVVVLKITGREFEIAWVGDSRAYRIGSAIEQLTVDHSYVQRLIDDGQISGSEARRHPRRNMLTAMLGGDDLAAQDVGVVSGTVAEGELLLLSSDGLHDLLAEDELRCLAQDNKDLDALVESLLEAALDKGGTDNISLVAVRPG